MAEFRVAAFNLENFDETGPGGPSLEERIVLMRPQVRRLRAGVVFFQEVRGQRRALLALGAYEISHLLGRSLLAALKQG